MINNLQFTIYKKQLFIAFCLLFIVFSPSPRVHAQATEYELLAPIPLGNQAPVEGMKTKTSDFLRGLFQLIIGLATALAVVMIMYGGVQYMTTDAWDNKSSAKKTIEDALMGLLLAIASWLILNTINPNLVNLTLEIPRIKIATSTSSGGGAGGGGRLPGYPLTPVQVQENNNIKQRLESNNPKVGVNAGPCTNSQTRGCTNLVGLPTSAIDGVMSLASQCKSAMSSDCNIIVSGGSEGGHLTHGPGKPQMDLKPNTTLNKYILQEGTVVVPPSTSCSRLNTQFRVKGAIYVREPDPDHWHVCY